MKQMRKNIRMVGIILLTAFIGVGGWFGYTVYSQGSRWMINQYNTRLSSAKGKITLGDIVDCDGVVLATTDSDGQRVYASDKKIRRALSQTVGDPLSMSGTGVETFHSGTLLGFSGSIIDRAWQWFKGESYSGDNLRLTVDAALSSYVSEIFPSKSEGAVVILNYQTGEILCMVSKPDYDPSSISSRNIDKEGTAYLNRCLQGQYTPGSVFKIVTLAAALENLPGITGRVFTCEGTRAYGDVNVRCIKGTAHGEISLKEAFYKSCNVTFGALSYELGASTMLKTANAMGFNNNFRFQDVVLYESSFPDDISSVGELAWSGAGQGRVLVTPMHMAMIAGSVANKGVMVSPELILQVYGSTGIARPHTSSGAFGRVMSESTAATVKEYMRLTVEQGTAKKAAIKGVTVCGKTGSAETSDDKNKETNAWYVGFIDDNAHPYAIAVVIEEGGSGGDKAAALASKALSKAISLTE